MISGVFSNAPLSKHSLMTFLMVVCGRVRGLISSTIHFLEVLGDCLIHMVTLCNEPVPLHHGPDNRVSALDLRTFSAVA